AITLAKQPKAKDTHVAYVKHESLPYLTAYREVCVPGFGVSQVIRYGAHAAEEGPAGRYKRRECGCGRCVREKGQNGLVLDRCGEQIQAIEVERVEYDVEERQLGHLRERRPYHAPVGVAKKRMHQPLLVARAPGDSNPWLEVVVIGGACRDD